MPIPLLPVLAAAVFGRATKKDAKKQAVSKYTKKSGAKVRAYTRKAPR
jgi:hypothetical protein